MKCAKCGTEKEFYGLVSVEYNGEKKRVCLACCESLADITNKYSKIKKQAIDDWWMANE